MRPKLNCLFKRVCSNDVEDLCLKEFKIKDNCIQNGYFVPYLILNISTLTLKLDQNIFQIE